MSSPQSPDRFNEDAATYTVKGGDDTPDLDRGRGGDPQRAEDACRKIPVSTG